MYGEHQQTSNDNACYFGDGELSRADQKDRFVVRFESELQRLDDAGHTLTSWEEENLMGALGAASLGEHDLACGMIESSKRSPPGSSIHQRAFHRQPMSLGALRRRFERLG
jgi:hypothetical protein